MSETCDWLTLLLARVLSEYRDNQLWRESLMQHLDQMLNASPADMLVSLTLPLLFDAWTHTSQGPITITEFSLGEEFPLLKHAAVQLSSQEQLVLFTFRTLCTASSRLLLPTHNRHSL